MDTKSFEQAIMATTVYAIALIDTIFGEEHWSDSAIAVASTISVMIANKIGESPINVLESLVRELATDDEMREKFLANASIEDADIQSAMIARALNGVA